MRAQTAARTSRHPVSPEIGATLGAFVSGGVGPRHSVLSRVFDRAGFGHVAPYDRSNPDLQPNKEDRVRLTVAAAVASPARSRDLVEGILSEYRADGCFRSLDEPTEERARQAQVHALKCAFARIDWELTDDGELRPAGVGPLTATQGRPAIEDQLARVRRATDDPALLVGTAKEMLESTAKYVLEEYSVPYTPKTSFDELWFHARDRLGIHPKDIDVNVPGGEQVREILQSSWTIARMANEVRNVEGTGHGRTLPSAMTSEMALLVVREAASIVQLVLSTLDRYRGR